MKICIRTKIIAIWGTLPLLWGASNRTLHHPIIERYISEPDRLIEKWHLLEKKAFSQLPPQHASTLKVKSHRLRDLASSLLKSNTPPDRGFNGVFNSHGIQISKDLSPSEFSSVLIHELAHVFLEETCPGKLTGDYLIHETLSQWLSEDFIRISYGSSQFAYSQHARQWLKQWQNSSLEQHVASYAIARILHQMNGDPSPLRLIIDDIFTHCRVAEWTPGPSHQKILKLLTETSWDEDEARKKPRLEPDFLLVDGLSMEPIIESGRTQEGFPPGSILKPLLVATVPELRHPTSAGSSGFWDCNGKTMPRNEQWTWQEALIHSCNGFFLEHHRQQHFDFKAWVDLLNAFGIKHPFMGKDSSSTEKILQVSLGLLPGISITPTQVVGLYRWLFDHSPEIPWTLIQTGHRGTLQDAEDGRWLAAQGFALKTGTLRNSLQQPIDAWLVGLGPLKSGKKSPDLVFAAHGHGQAPRNLTKTVALAVRQLPSGVGFPTQVQILSHQGFVPSLSIQCKNQLFSLTELPLQSLSRPVDPLGILPIKAPVLLDLKMQHQFFTCYDGPLFIQSTPPTGKKMTYYGRLRVQPIHHQDHGESSLPLTPHRAKARRGSVLILETSALHYIKNVLASEYPNGYEATLKALALAIGYNVQSHRHGDRPICDSSHCQIFSSTAKLGKTLREKRLHEIAQWSLSFLAAHSTAPPFTAPVNSPGLLDAHPLEPAACAPAPWYPFSLGGSDVWTREISHHVIASSFALADTSGMEIFLETPADASQTQQPTHVMIKHAQGQLHLSCEVFRNQLKLPSCPTRVQSQALSMVFGGKGEGHGLGLDLLEADLLSGRGAREQEVFRRYFPLSPPFCMANLLPWKSL